MHISKTKSDKMPGVIQESPFKTIQVKELHPTFGAEVSGVNFQDLSEEQFKEILAAMAKVNGPPIEHITTQPEPQVANNK